MRIRRVPHSWSVTPKRAIEIQRALARRVVRSGRIRNAKLVAGVDLAFDLRRGECIAGVVVWDVRSREVAEQRVLRRPLQFPYVPGLLSFREAPAILAVLRKLRLEPDVLMFDGQGYAHPRRFGLACHVGVLINRPSLGCAKSLLVGNCDPPGVHCGSTSSIEHKGERIGLAVRTRDHVKPVFVSVGHRISLASAVRVTLATGEGFRLPEPTRLADRLVAREKGRSK